jgi:hypothetical protein
MNIMTWSSMAFQLSNKLKLLTRSICLKISRQLKAKKSKIDRGGKWKISYICMYLKSYELTFKSNEEMLLSGSQCFHT